MAGRSPYHRAAMRKQERMMPSRRASAPSPAKARKILHDGTVHGKPITPKQRGFLGAVASKAKRH